MYQIKLIFTKDNIIIFKMINKKKQHNPNSHYITKLTLPSFSKIISTFFHYDASKAKKPKLILTPFLLHDLCREEKTSYESEIEQVKVGWSKIVIPT